MDHLVLSRGQIKYIVSLFRDLSKSMFVAAFAAPILSDTIELLMVTKTFLIGVMFAYLCMVGIRLEEQYEC